MTAMLWFIGCCALIAAAGLVGVLLRRRGEQITEDRRRAWGQVYVALTCAECRRRLEDGEPVTAWDNTACDEKGSLTGTCPACVARRAKR